MASTKYFLAGEKCNRLRHYVCGFSVGFKLLRFCSAGTEIYGNCKLKLAVAVVGKFKVRAITNRM